MLMDAGMNITSTPGELGASQYSVLLSRVPESARTLRPPEEFHNLLYYFGSLCNIFGTVWHENDTVED
jgi:hypothetical protein